MIKRRRLLFLILASSAFALIGSGPVSATHTADHTAAEIGQVVNQAGNDSDSIVAALSNQISKLSDENSVDDAADAALTEVESVWSAARTTVDDLISLYPGELGRVGGEAKQELQAIRLAARNTVSALADDWTPPAPATTTTTTTPTSAAAPPPPAAGGNGPGSNKGTPPGSNSGNRPEPENGGPEAPEATNPEPEAGPDPVPGPDPDAGLRPVPQPTPPFEGVAPALGPELALVLELAALTPDQPFTVSQEAISSLMTAQETGATATMAKMLNTVLPPAVVDLVLSPLLILEILVRTLIDGGSRLVGPLTLFAVSAMALFVYDRFSKRNLIGDQIRSSS